MLNVSKTLNRYEAAKLLARQKEEVLQKWEALCREKIPAAKGESHLALRNSLPQFLDKLVNTLISAEPKVQAEKETEAADEHAENRADKPAYSLDQVIGEFCILRNVIIENLISEAQLDSQSLKVIHEFLDNGIQDSAVRYTEIEKNLQANMVEIEANKIEAERANEAKSAFLANMSHEIRTPLGAIMGFVELLHDKELSQKEISNYLSIIDRNGIHLLRIIDDILDLTKVESGKMIIEKIEFSLPEFLSEFSLFMGFRAREKGISFEFIAETLIPEFVISDPTRLRQILTNMVSNALKFTEKGRIELTVLFNVQLLRFRLKDTGKGISPEQRSKLFQVFSQADSSTTRKFGGTGLGLVLARKISKALGGEFDLSESEIGKGSTFVASIQVALPVGTKLVPLRKVGISPTLCTDSNQIVLKGFKILVVEDSPDNQNLVNLILTKTGAKITLANDGLEGVKSALAHRYDVILMDIQMPNMDGHEAVRALRAKGYTGPIVALTAHAMREERERAVQSGFSHFLTKPINRKELIDLMVEIRSRFVFISCY